MAVLNKPAPQLEKTPLLSASRMDWLWAIVVFSLISLTRLGVAGAVVKERAKTLDDILGKWDALHYIAIARGGYFETGPGLPPNEYESRLAFFPLLPYSMRALHTVTRLDYPACGLLISFCAGCAMVAAVMFIAAHMGAPLWGRLAAGVLVAGAPMGFTYNMVYTEGLFAALSYWTLWALLKRKWWLAGVVGLLAGLTRVTGLDLLIVFALVVVVYGRRNWRAWAALMLASSGIASYLWFASSKTRHIGGYFGLQKKGWNSFFDYGKSTREFLRWAFTGTNDSWVVISGLSIVFFVAILVYSVTRVPWPVWLFSAGIVANVLLSNGVITARPRLMLPAVICLIPAAVAIARRAEASPRFTTPELATIRTGWICVQFFAVSLLWVIFGTLVSVHPLVATKWAI